MAAGNKEAVPLPHSSIQPNHWEALMTAWENDWIDPQDSEITVQEKLLNLAEVPPNIARFFLLRSLHEEKEQLKGFDNGQFDDFSKTFANDEEFWRHLSALHADQIMALSGSESEDWNFDVILVREGEATANSAADCYFLKSQEKDTTGANQLIGVAVTWNAKGTDADFFIPTGVSNPTTQEWELFEMSEVLTTS